MLTLNFTAPHKRQFGGLFTAHEAFKMVGKSKIIDVVGKRDYDKTQSDYQLKMDGIGIKNNYGIPFPFSFSKNWEAVSDLIKDLNADLLVVHSLFSDQATYGYKFAKKFNIPYIFVPHGVLDPYVFSYNKLRKNAWMKLYGRRIISDSSAIICATNREAEKAEPFLRHSNIEICEWGIELPQVQNRQIWRSQMREKLGIKNDEKVLFFLGRMNKMKRPVEIAKRFLEVSKKGWKLLLVGYFESEDIVRELKSIVRDHANVILKDAIEGDDKWKLFAASDAFIHLSERENFGYSVVEAASMGLPLILSQGVDVYPYFSPDAAFVSPSKNPSCEIAILKEALSTSNEKLKYMGKNAEHIVSQNFTNDQFKSKLLAIFEKYKSNAKDKLTI